MKTLDAGTYAVIVDDHSRRAGFHLDGPGLAEATANRFVGRRRWRLEVGTDAPYDSTFTYQGARESRSSFVVH